MGRTEADVNSKGEIIISKPFLRNYSQIIVLNHNSSTSPEPFGSMSAYYCKELHPTELESAALELGFMIINAPLQEESIVN